RGLPAGAHSTPSFETALGPLVAWGRFDRPRPRPVFFPFALVSGATWSPSLTGAGRAVLGISGPPGVGSQPASTSSASAGARRRRRRAGITGRLLTIRVRSAPRAARRGGPASLGSQRVGGDHLSAGLGAQASVHPQVDRVLEELHRPVAEQE